jgi:hypothetical protein
MLHSRLVNLMVLDANQFDISQMLPILEERCLCLRGLLQTKHFHGWSASGVGAGVGATSEALRADDWR